MRTLKQIAFIIEKDGDVKSKSLNVEEESLDEVIKELREIGATDIAISKEVIHQIQYEFEQDDY